MNIHSGIPTSFSTPHIYTSRTAAARLSLLPECVQPLAPHCPGAFPSYQCLPRSQLQFTQSHPDHVLQVPRSPRRSHSRSRHSHDPFDRSPLLTRSTPRDCLEDPPSRYSNSKMIYPPKTKPQPELTTQQLDDLGLPHFDLRFQLAECVTMLEEHRFDLKQPSATSVRIISQAFAWNIDVAKSNHGNITWKDMLEALYNDLHKQIEDHEWSILMLDRDPQYKVDIETFANTRINRTPRSNVLVKPDHRGHLKTNDGSMTLKRIDCLGRKTAFLGFRRDKDLEEMRRMPYSKLPIPEVWAVELGMSGRGRGRM